MKRKDNKKKFVKDEETYEESDEEEDVSDHLS